MHNKILIAGILIDNVSMKEALKQIEGFIKEKKSHYVVTPNVDHIVKLKRDSAFKEVYDNASLVLADGMPLIWLSKLLKTKLKEKVSGSDIFPQLFKLASQKKYKIFLLGGLPESAEKTKEILNKKLTNKVEVKIYCPKFDFEKEDKINNMIINMIKDAAPDMLFVGLGTPKQELWIYRYLEELKVPISMGIGATFDFIAGKQKRAPEWMQKNGLEWFWRLLFEPKRLWKRYLIDDLLFLWLALKQLLKRYILSIKFFNLN